MFIFTLQINTRDKCISGKLINNYHYTARALRLLYTCSVGDDTPSILVGGVALIFRKSIKQPELAVKTPVLFIVIIFLYSIDFFLVIYVTFYNYNYNHFKHASNRTMGPSIKYVMLFLVNFDPHPCHTLSQILGPPKFTSHISYPPPLISSRPSTKIPDKSPLYKFSLNCSRGLCSGLLSNCRTFSDPLILERDVLYGRPPFSFTNLQMFPIYLRIPHARVENIHSSHTLFL